MSEELIQALSEEVKCNICLELFEDPRVLECLHTFCYACAVKMGKKSGTRTIIECPLCRNVTFLGASGVEGLKKNHYLSNIVDKLRTSPSVPISSPSRTPALPQNFDYPNLPPPSAPPLEQNDASVLNNNLAYNSNSSASTVLGSISSFISSWFHGSTSVATPVLGDNTADAQHEFVSLGCNIRLTEVPTIFDTWIKSLWFPPSDLQSTVILGAIDIVYIPFWMYEVAVTTACAAKVVRNDADPHHGTRAGNEHIQSVEGVYNHTYPKLLICAPSPSAQGYDKVVVSLVDQMSNLEKYPLIRSAPPPMRARVWHSLLYTQVWSEIGEKIIQRKEREKCEADLSSQPFVASVKELSLDINFNSVNHRLVHLPFYVTVSFA